VQLATHSRRGLHVRKEGCALIKRIIRLLAVTALVVLALAVPAFAAAPPDFVDSQGNKPFTYGDCVSSIASLYPGYEKIGESVQDFTETTEPLQAEGEEGTWCQKEGDLPAEGNNQKK
jgi:hypothetical protein